MWTIPLRFFCIQALFCKKASNQNMIENRYPKWLIKNALHFAMEYAKNRLGLVSKCPVIDIEKSLIGLSPHHSSNKKHGDDTDCSTIRPFLLTKYGWTQEFQLCIISSCCIPSNLASNTYLRWGVILRALSTQLGPKGRIVAKSLAYNYQCHLYITTHKQKNYPYISRLKLSISQMLHTIGWTLIWKPKVSKHPLHDSFNSGMRMRDVT